MNFKSLIGKKFSKDFILSIGSLGTVSVIGIGINVVLGNHYGPSGLGTYSFAFSIYMLLAAFSIFGLKSSSIKYTGEYSRSPEKKVAAMKASLIISGITAIIATAGVFLINKWNLWGDNFSDTINIFYALPFYTLNEVLFGYINGLRKMKLYSILRSVRWLLIAIFLSISILLKLTVNQAFFAFPITELTLLVIFGTINKNELFRPTKNIKPCIKQHLSFGSKIILTDVVNQLNNKLSIILLGTFLTKDDVGIFSFASTMTSGLLMIPSTVALNFNPIIADLWKNNKKRLNVYIKEVKKWTLIITLPLFAVSALTYPFFIKFGMKGKDYNESIAIFYILLLGNTSLTLIYWASGFLTMAGFPQEKLKARSILLVINLSLSFLLIKGFGITGAAIATTVTNIVWTIIIIVIIKKKLNLKLI